MLKQKLLKLREKTIAASKEIKKELRTSLQESLQELSLYDNHPADIGEATWERSKALSLQQFFEARLRQIDQALAALEEGTYGLCRECGRKIEQDRLKVIPYTTTCLVCKEKQETKLDKRPLEEEIIGGMQGLDPKENNAFDGEDAWQAVARYGSSDSLADVESGIDNYLLPEQKKFRGKMKQEE